MEKVKARLKGRRPLIGGRMSKITPKVRFNNEEREDVLNVYKYSESKNVNISEPINDKTPKEFEAYIGNNKLDSKVVRGVRNVELFGRYAIPVTTNGEYIMEEMERDSSLRELLGKTSDRFIITKTFGPKLRKIKREIIRRVGLKNDVIESPIINLVPRHFGGEGHSRHGNYGHWVAEDLPRLKGLKEYCDIKGVDPKILIMDDPPSWMTETLELLGFPPKLWKKWDKKSSVVSELVVPDLRNFHSTGTDFDPSGRRWVSRRIKNNVDLSGSNDLPNRIFASRQGSGFRKIANFSEVKEVLNIFKVKPVRNEEMSVKEQVKMYSNAELVIGVFGANLTNIIFSSNATIVEIFDNDDIRPVYFVTAAEQSLDYAYLTGEGNRSTFNSSEYNITLDPNKLKKMLKSILD